MNSPSAPEQKTVTPEWTNRTRVIKTLTCQPTDRPPFIWWMGWWPWEETQRRWQEESGIRDLNLADYFGAEPSWQCAPTELGAFPHFEPVELGRDSEHIISLDYRGIKMRNRIDGASMPEFLDYPIKSREDWDRYKVERLGRTTQERTQGIEKFCEWMKTFDAPVQLGYFPWGVFGTVRDLMGVEQFMYALGDDPDWIEDIMTTFVDMWLGIYEEVTRHIQVDILFSWEDMAGNNGSLISARMMERFMMPHYDRLHEFRKKHQIPVMCVDSDGKVDMVLEVMTKHGVNAFFPFEVHAGSDVEEFGRKYPELGLIGGLDKAVLTQNKAAMNKEIDRAVRLFNRGGYLAGFDHLIPPDVPWANYQYFMQTIRKEMGL